MRASAKTYLIHASFLGPLKRVHIQKDLHNASEIGSGWFLENVTVIGPEGHKTVFPCHAWVGEPDDQSGVGAACASLRVAMPSAYDGAVSWPNKKLALFKLTFVEKKTTSYLESFSPGFDAYLSQLVQCIQQLQFRAVDTPR